MLTVVLTCILVICEYVLSLILNICELEHEDQYLWGIYYGVSPCAEAFMFAILLDPYNCPLSPWESHSTNEEPELRRDQPARSWSWGWLWRFWDSHGGGKAWVCLQGCTVEEGGPCAHLPNQWNHNDGLKLSVVGVFTPGKSANTANQGSLPRKVSG